MNNNLEHYLNRKFAFEKLIIDNAKYNIWKTPYKFSIENPTNSIFYFYRYDNNLKFVNNDNFIGLIEPADIPMVIEQLEVEPNKILKPMSVINLEKEFGLNTVRNINCFGSWHLQNDIISLYNNPFGCQNCYSDSDDNFEIWLKNIDGKVHKYIPLQKIRELLRKIEI